MDGAAVPGTWQRARAGLQHPGAGQPADHSSPRPVAAGGASAHYGLLFTHSHTRTTVLITPCQTCSYFRNLAEAEEFLVQNHLTTFFLHNSFHDVQLHE